MSSHVNSNPRKLTNENHFNEPETGLNGSTCHENDTLRVDEIEEEAVDELLLILVECLRRADIKTREVLLRKFFLEIESEESLERFLVERMKRSKILDLLSELSISEKNNNAPACISHNVSGMKSDEISVMVTRGVNGLSGDEIMMSRKKKMERFKLKTVQIRDVVRQEAE